MDRRRKVNERVEQRIKKLLNEGRSKSEVGRLTMLNRETVARVARKR